MALRRIILVCWIALSVAVAPVASAWASMNSGKVASGHELIAPVHMAASDASTATADMVDCHKAMKTSGGCPCCDVKAQCPADAACMTKCCKVLGSFTGMIQLPRLTRVDDRAGEPEKPPEWVSKPPSPPPRT